MEAHVTCFSQHIETPLSRCFYEANVDMDVLPHIFLQVLLEGLVAPEKRDSNRRLRFDGDRFLKTRQHILRQSHFRQRKQEGQG